MIVRGVLCPHCGAVLNSDPPYIWPEQWIGWIGWACCKPCERFFYVLSDENRYPVAVIDAERGIGEGDEGYSFDPEINGEDRDDEGWYYHQQWLANQPKCDMCGVRTPIPVAGSKRCQTCLDRFGAKQAVQS